MNRIEVIQHAIAKHGFTAYLELGCGGDNCFKVVNCPVKVGVDRACGGTLRMTTDEFFAQNQQKFDVIFIDANHHHEQVLHDLCNSLKALTPDGLIVMHDCNPMSLEAESQVLSGTAWRVVAGYIRSRLDLQCAVGDFDCGVACVRRGDNEMPLPSMDMDALTYDDLATNRHVWLPLMNWVDLREWL